MGIKDNKSSHDPGLCWPLVNLSGQPPISHGPGPIMNCSSTNRTLPLHHTRTMPSPAACFFSFPDDELRPILNGDFERFSSEIFIVIWNTNCMYSALTLRELGFVSLRLRESHLAYKASKLLKVLSKLIFIWTVSMNPILFRDFHWRNTEGHQIHTHTYKHTNI